MLTLIKCFKQLIRLKEIRFLFELQAHDRPCTRICMLNEKTVATVTTLKFVTCTDKDANAIKVWSFEWDSAKKPGDSSSSVVLAQNLKTSPTSSVVFVDVVKLAGQRFLLTVESDSRIIVKFYKTGGAFLTPHASSGCSIMSARTVLMVNRVKVANETILCITLLVDEIIRVNLSEIVNRFQTYNLENENVKKSLCLVARLANEPVELSLEGSKKLWFSTVEKYEETTLAGDHQGNLYMHEDLDLKLTKVKSIHKSRVTELVRLKTSKKCERLVSSSHDGTIKIWSKNAQTQLGQYNTNSGVAVLARIPSLVNTHTTSKLDYFNFIFGDQMGNLNLLRWYDE